MFKVFQTTNSASIVEKLFERKMSTLPGVIPSRKKKVGQSRQLQEIQPAQDGRWLGQQNQ